MTDSVEFIVPGAVVPKARPRARIVQGKGKQFASLYTPSKTVSFENLVKIKAEAAMNGNPPISGALRMTLVIHLAPPASWSIKKRDLALSGIILPEVKPDFDNAAKSVCDAMNGIVYGDDKQICDARVIKLYSRVAKTIISISRIE